MNTIFKNAEESALMDGFDQIVATNKKGKIFFTRLMGNINCSCVSETDKIIGCVTVIPHGEMKKAQFIRA